MDPRLPIRFDSKTMGSHAALAIVASALSYQASAQGCDRQPFTSIQEALFKEVEPRMSSCAPMPGDPQAGVALFAFERSPSADDGKTYDVELLLVDLRSNRLKARLSLKDVWPSDACKIDFAQVAERAYPVRRGAKVFGVNEAWSASSSVSFYNINTLSLFVQRGTTIVPVLTGLVTDIYQGRGAMCASLARSPSSLPRRGAMHPSASPNVGQALRVRISAVRRWKPSSAPISSGIDKEATSCRNISNPLARVDSR